MNAFMHALKFLTRLLAGFNRPYAASLAGQAVTYYSLVGLLIGLLLAAAAWVIGGWLNLPAMPTAALVLCFWVWLSGALHLDGLGDCSDAWMSGAGTERMLAIMKDSYCGVGAIVAIVLVLLVKFSALSVLLPSLLHGNRAADGWLLLLLAPVIARALLAFSIYRLPYIKASRLGLGADLKPHLAPQKMALVTGGLLLVLAALAFKATVFALLGGLLGFLILYFAIIKKIHGMTGDVYGALVEITEASALLGIVASLA